MRAHGLSHVVDVLERHGADRRKIRRISRGGWRLPSGFRFYVRVRSKPNSGGEWFFTVAPNVLGSDSGYLIFVFGEECRCAVAEVDEFAWISGDQGIYPSRTGRKPTFQLGPGWLRLRVGKAETLDVSQWLGHSIK